MPSTPTDPTKAQVWITGTAPNQQFEFYIPRGAKGEPGGITQGTLLTTGDLNDVKVSGVYRQDNGTNIALLKNYPENSGETGILVVHAVNTSFIEQQWYPSDAVRNGRVFWTRSYNYGVWRPWRAYPYTRIDSTAGRAIYTWDPANSRDQLIGGDTGRRDISGMCNGTFSGGGKLSLRREGSMVELYLINWQPGVVGAVNLLTTGLPAGYRPSNSRLFWATQNGSPVSGTVAFDGSGINLVSTHATQFMAFSFAYSCTDQWPTTLPGVADGAIPIS